MFENTNFRQEATVLAKQMIDTWRDTRDFEAVVVILEDYLTDQNTVYTSRINELKC